MCHLLQKEYKAPEAEAPRKIEGKSGNRKVRKRLLHKSPPNRNDMAYRSVGTILMFQTKICLTVFFALLLLLILVGVGLILVQNFLKEEEKKEGIF